MASGWVVVGCGVQMVQTAELLRHTITSTLRRSHWKSQLYSGASGACSDVHGMGLPECEQASSQMT